MKIRVLKKREKGREKAKIFLPALLFLIVFPYIISGFSGQEKQIFANEEVPGQIWVLEKKFWGTGKVPLEEYLVGMMAATIPAEYEPETLKAQAIILRSFCMNHMEKENGEKIIRDDVIKEYYMRVSQCEEIWQENSEVNLQKLQEAVKETKGMIVVCNGDIVAPSFCRMSNGKTRDVTEYVMRREKYSYMKSVACERDKMAADYVQYVKFSHKDFEEIIKNMISDKNAKLEKLIIYRDKNDYVKEIHIGEKVIDGEEFRKSFNLVSSCYSLEIINNAIEIQTKGIGHGFGFSQYEADRLAQEGNNYTYLLKYFFDNIELEKV